MSHSIAGCASMARSILPMSAPRMISQRWVLPASFAPFYSFPFVSRGNLLEHWTARRTEVRPFTPAQIKLLETFADQAVIAIENVRLFQELKESLEQQTATSEILGVIASSPTDVQPVLDAVAENAARLCGSQDAQIYRVEGDIVRKVASYGAVSPYLRSARPNRSAVVWSRAVPYLTVEPFTSRISQPRRTESSLAQSFSRPQGNIRP